VYEWYFQKNVAMGAYSAQEIKNETTFFESNERLAIELHAPSNQAKSALSSLQH